MSNHLEAAEAVEVLPTVEADETVGPGSGAAAAYSRMQQIAQDLDGIGIQTSFRSDLLLPLANRVDTVLSGDERTFFLHAIVVPALSGFGLVAAILPSMDSLRRCRRMLESFQLKVASFDLAPTKSDKRAIWEQLDRGELDVILISPGRLASSRFRERLARRPLGLITIANAHLMSPWSHRFVPSYRQIGSFVAGLKGVTKVAHVWSAENRVQQDLQRVLGLSRTFHGRLKLLNDATPSVRGEVVHNDQERLDLMSDFIVLHGCQGVVHVGSVKQLYDTKKWLESLGETPVISRPGMDEFSLQKVRTGFETGEIRIVISQGPFLSTLENAPGLEFVIFNGLPESLEYVGQEIFAHSSAAPLACLCLASENDFYHHRFAIDKNYPDALTLRACFKGTKDAFGSAGRVTAETLRLHVKVATPFPDEDIGQCLSVMLREGLTEQILDASTDQIMVKMADNSETENNFWHEYPLRKLEQISRLERTRDFLATSGELGKQLRDLLHV